MSGRLPGSILEAPGLDFGARKGWISTIFFVYFGKVSSKQVLQKMPPKIYNAKKATKAKKAKKANLLQGANAQSATTKA